MVEEGKRMCLRTGMIRIQCDVFCLLYFRGLGKQGYQCQGEKTHTLLLTDYNYVSACTALLCMNIAQLSVCVD